MSRSPADIREHLEHSEECLGEIWSQYHSEVSLYGDAWPGAQIQLNELEESVARLKVELLAATNEAMEGVEFYIPPRPAGYEPPNDDIPF